MIFVRLSEEEFTQFASHHPQESFFQTVELGHLRHLYGSELHFLGVKEKEQIIAASMLTETRTIAGKRTFYAPRGFLIDYHDKQLLSYFTKNLIDNLKELGYHHYGFNLDFEFTQSRWNFRVSLDVPYEELKKRFSKSTRKNIEATYKKGLQVRIGTKDDLNSMEDILIQTAERKNFAYRSLDYYTKMYDCMGDLMRIYIAYVEPMHYIECAKQSLEEAKAEYQTVLDKMKKDMVGAKLKQQETTLQKKISKCEQELEAAYDFQKKYPQRKDIGVLISLKSGLEYLTLYSGYLVEFHQFTPKYAMYNEHILDAYRFQIPYVNFYGISGVFDPKDKNYGMYEFKRGFGGNVVELIGEFTYPVSYWYYIYMLLRRSKIFLRKWKAKRK